MKLAKAVLLLTLASVAAWAQVNAGEQKPEATMPFNMTTAATFELPWRIAFLPDGRMLITEKIGPLWLVSAAGREDRGGGRYAPVYWQGQSGMLGVYVSPNYATDQNIYLTYSEPGDYGGGLALARAKLNATATSATAAAGNFPGAVAPDAQGQGRPGGRRTSPSRPTASLCSSRLATASASPRPGSEPACRQDPAPDAGRQTRPRQSQRRQDRRCAPFP